MVHSWLLTVRSLHVHAENAIIHFNSGGELYAQVYEDWKFGPLIN